AFAILQSSVDSPLKKHVDDVSLRRFCYVSAAAASAGVLHGEMKWRRARLIFQSWIGACLEQQSDSSNASRSNGPVQWSRAIAILCVDHGAGIEKAADRFQLPFFIPGRASDVAIGRIVQRTAVAAVVCCIRIGACLEQDLHNLRSIAGRGQMQ